MDGVLGSIVYEKRLESFLSQILMQLSPYLSSCDMWLGVLIEALWWQFKNKRVVFMVEAGFTPPTYGL